MNITTGQLAAILDGELIGDSDIAITHPAKIETAGKGAISFIANPKYLHYLTTTKASAILVSRDLELKELVEPALIQVDNVYLALSKLLEMLGIGPAYPSGISERATIADDVEIGENVAVGEYAVIEKKAVIGAGSRIFAQAYIGKGVEVGKNCIIFPGVKIYHDTEIGDNCVIHSNSVIGSDGFGFTPDDKGTYHKIPQVGRVVLEEDVEIGANVVIDRATMGETVIGKGVKLDNLIQIAHNVKIGKNTVIAAQAGIAGTAVIGENVVIGGQVGVAGHLKVADRTMIQGQSGIASDVTDEGSKLYGSPALSYQNYLRSYALFKKLPEIMMELQNLRTEVEKLKNGNK